MLTSCEGMSPVFHADDCECAECQQWNAYEERGVMDLEDQLVEALEADFERNWEGERAERGLPNKFGERP